MREFKTIRIQDVFVCMEEGDYALQHLMKDERSIIVSNDGPSSTRHINFVDIHEVYIKSRGMGVISLAALHYWENGIDFDYIDVGANIGMTVCVEAMLHKMCKRQVLCHAFEPGDVFEFLERTVAANGFEDVVICNKMALSDKSGTAKFHNTNSHSAASSLIASAVRRNQIDDVSVKSVPVIRLDDYAKDLRIVPGIISKIDAEGADLLVLSGMSGLIRNRLCTVLIEFTPALIDDYADPADRLHELSKDFYLVEVSTGRTTPILSDREWIVRFVSDVRDRPESYSDIMLISKMLPKATDLFSRVLIG